MTAEKAAALTRVLNIHTRLADCKQLVSDCKAALKKRGFMSLYKALHDRWNDGAHTYNGPLFYTIQEHLSGRINSDVQQIYNEMKQNGDMIVPSEADVIKPKKEDRAMLDVLVWANVGAEKLDAENYFQ
jgi:hypothetical protein